MLRLYAQCDRGMSGYCYPDGGGVIDQPLLLLDAFAAIGHARAMARKAEREE